VTPPLLEIRGVTKRFGGLVANREISFQVGPGELVGVIGPNGAGKSTLFDLLTGFQTPDAGHIRLDGVAIAGLRPDEISRRGVGRTFQKTADPRSARAEAERALASVGLADRAGAHARVLSTGQRKRLEMARALATRPRLLLLDEITGGVDQRSIPALVELVRQLHAGGTALIVIEHNMRVIMGISQRVVALHLGEVIAVGSPAAVTSDARVIEAYLGRAYGG